MDATTTQVLKDLHEIKASLLALIATTMKMGYEIQNTPSSQGMGWDACLADAKKLVRDISAHSPS